MRNNIKLVAVDVDGTFVRSDYTYDVPRFKRILVKWVDDLKKVRDQILKFAPTVPEEKTYFYYEIFCDRLKGKVEPTTSGHGSIDLVTLEKLFM